MPAARRRAWLVAPLLLCAGCARSSGSVELMAAFSDDTVVGQLTARWDAPSARRDATPAGRDCTLALHVDALNRLSDPLYVRLRDVRLIGPGGAYAVAPAAVECALAPGPTRGVLAGSVALPCTDATGVRAFRVDALAVPLSQRGRSFYREFLLGQRPSEAAAIDTEIAALAAAPPCRGSD
jgi:hypothetical protein